MFLVPVSRNGSDLNRGFDRLFDDAFDRLFGLTAPPADTGAARSPALDVAESERQYTVKLDMPGVSRNDVKVSIDGRRVNVEAQVRKEDERKDGDRVVYRERTVSSYSRSFTLPAEIDQAESGAKFEDGVLTLTLAKRRASASAHLKVN